MGQYFVAVNESKKEFICPWCIGGGAKLWEWAANPKGAIFSLLLRRSSDVGGGDYNAGPPTVIDASSSTPDEVAETIARGVLREGKPTGLPSEHIVGRWAGDKVSLVGDYDDSKLYQKAKNDFRNVSEEIVEAWNSFIDIEEMKLTYSTDCSCSEKE